MHDTARRTGCNSHKTSVEQETEGERGEQLSLTNLHVNNGCNIRLVRPVRVKISRTQQNVSKNCDVSKEKTQQGSICNRYRWVNYGWDDNLDTCVPFGWRDKHQVGATVNDIPVCGRWSCCLGGEAMTHLCVDNGCAAQVERQTHEMAVKDIPVCGCWSCCSGGETNTGDNTVRDILVCGRCGRETNTGRRVQPSRTYLCVDDGCAVWVERWRRWQRGRALQLLPPPVRRSW